jgi:XapX domain-containing protein
MRSRSARAAIVLRYSVSFAAGCLAAVIFAVLRTPVPVPPLVGLVGLLGITAGEVAMQRLLAVIARRRREAGPGSVVR